MEPNDNRLSSYFHHLDQQQQQKQSTITHTTTASPTNGLLASTDGSRSHSHSHMGYPHTHGTVPSAVSSQSQVQVEPQPQPAKRKRGRPRKYGSQEQALAAKKAATTSSSHYFSPNDNALSASASKKTSRSSFLGNAGQDFTPHIINVAAGEDVAQKIMLFMQQSSREMCILSASGCISDASLRQPATSGGTITYEGQFEIISLTGSYVRNKFGGRTGGLSACLSNTDGQIIGGGAGGPLKAAGPVQVIVGTFFIDPKKDASARKKGDASASKLPPPVGESVSSLGFRPAVDSSSGSPIRGNEKIQAIGGSHFMIQQCGMHVTPSRPSDWGGHSGSRNAGFELTGRSGHGAHQSPENGDYEQIPD